MSTTLFLSTHPGNALYGAGALLASLPAATTFHASAYAPRGAGECSAANLAETFTHEKAAFASLGVQAIEGSLVDPPNKVDDDVLQAKLSALVTTIRPDAVILPLGVAHLDGDLQLNAICLRLRQDYPQIRWLQYYDQPFIGLHRGRFPELAFARRVRMLAEVDDEASMFKWKLVGAPAALSPLERKLEACMRLGDRALNAQFFSPRGIEFPRERNLILAHLTRILGHREWLSTLG